MNNEMMRDMKQARFRNNNAAVLRALNLLCPQGELSGGDVECEDCANGDPTVAVRKDYGYVVKRLWESHHLRDVLP